MKGRENRAVVTLVALVAAALSGPALAARTIPLEPAKAIPALVQEWDKAVATGDPDKVMVLYNPSGAAMPPDGPARNNLKGIRDWFVAFFARSTVISHTELAKVEIYKDQAVARGTFTLDVTPRSGGAAVKNAGQWAAVFRRDPDGSWKILRNIWNSDKPTPGAPALPPFVAGAAPAAPDPKPCAAKPRAIDEAFARAFDGGDVASLVALHGEGAVRFPPGRSEVKGPASLASFFRSYIDVSDKRQLALRPTGSTYMGDMLTWWGDFQLTYVPKGGGATVHDKGKYMAFARKRGGCWFYDWAIWNSDRTPPAAGTAGG